MRMKHKKGRWQWPAPCRQRAPARAEGRLLLPSAPPPPPPIACARGAAARRRCGGGHSFASALHAHAVAAAERRHAAGPCEPKPVKARGPGLVTAPPLSPVSARARAPGTAWQAARAPGHGHGAKGMEPGGPTGQRRQRAGAGAGEAAPR
jgi:hypothetical protein